MQKEIPAVLFHIPLVRWVRRTIERVNDVGNDGFETWSKCWFETYKELDGQRAASGSKHCPQRAAHCLWLLGRISNSGKVFQHWTLERVLEDLGPNAVYSLWALDLLVRKRGEMNIPDNWSTAEIWAEVRKLYPATLGKQPAVSEQGAVRVALALFIEDQIVTKP